MAGRTVSTHVDEEIADSVERIAALEDRKVSRVAGAALSLYVRLSAEARDALRRIEALGDDRVREAALREIASVLIRMDYELAARRVADEMDRDALEDLESEEAILRRAIELTRSSSSGSPARVRERLEDSGAGDREARGEESPPSDGS